MALHAEGFEQETNWLYVHLLTVKSELTANSQYYIGPHRPEYTGRILPIQQERMYYVPAAAAADSTTHSGSKLLKTAQNKSSCCNFMIFYLKV